MLACSSIYDGVKTYCQTRSAMVRYLKMALILLISVGGTLWFVWLFPPPSFRAPVLISVGGVLWFVWEIFVGIPRKERKAIQRLSARQKSELAPFFDHPEIRAVGEAERKFVADVRHTIASLGCLEDDAIYPDDTFAQTLIELPFWDSLDFTEFIFALEDQTHMELPNEVIQRVSMTSFNRRDYTTASYIGELLNVFREYIAGNK